MSLKVRTRMSIGFNFLTSSLQGRSSELFEIVDNKVIDTRLDRLVLTLA
jgi:hypothetical protein